MEVSMIFCGGKGATAYELQIGSERFGSVQINWVRLSGGYYTRWAPWRRIQLQFWPGSKAN